MPIGETHDLRFRFEGHVPLLPGCLATVAIEAGDEAGTFAELVHLSRKRRVEERAVDNVLRAGDIERLEQFGRAAASTSSGIVAGIGINHRRALAEIGMSYRLGDGH